MLCEQQGYIETYVSTGPKDKVDETLLDMKRYTRTLVEQEANLSDLLEQAVRQVQNEDIEEANKEVETEIVDEDMSDIAMIEKQILEDEEAFYEGEDYIEDEDYEDFVRFLEEDDE